VTLPRAQSHFLLFFGSADSAGGQTFHRWNQKILVNVSSEHGWHLVVGQRSDTPLPPMTERGYFS
jgi:hypothetical protein